MDFAIIAIIIQLIFLECILSIDNAAVLGAMVSILPDNEDVPWPRGLARLGKALHPLLGSQRTAGLRMVILGAFLGNGLMLFLASLIVQNSWLKLIGALYLVHLAFDNLGQADPGEINAHTHPLKAGSFWVLVLNVELANLAFSIDNVIAAVSLSKLLWVMFLGMAIAILAMRFAAGLFSYAVLKEPILQSAAYILVLNIGIQLLLEEFAGIVISDWLRFGLSLGIILLALLYAHSPQWLKGLLAYPLNWLGRGFGDVNELVDWLLEPPLGLINLIFRGFRHLYQHNNEMEH